MLKSETHRDNNDKLEIALGHKPTPKQAPLKKIRVPVQKIRASFRIDSELWEQFISYNVRLGLTSCHVLEGIIAAFVTGTKFIFSSEHRKNSKTLCLQVPWICHTLNVEIAREQLRPRRNAYATHMKQVNPLLNFDCPCGETVNEVIWEY